MTGYGDTVSGGVEEVLLENEKVRKKLRKVQQRRDHYAKLYLQTMRELEETKWELAKAMNVIRELQQTQGQPTKIDMA